MKLVVLLGALLAAVISTASADCHCGEDFTGFGTAPGKCGCCPWPCCCKCFEAEPCEPTTTPEPCRCLELAIIIDGSGSIGSQDWREELLFISILAEALCNDTIEYCLDDVVEIAIVQFGNNATIDIGLTASCTIKNMIDETTVPQLKKATNIVEGMELAINGVFNQPTDCDRAAIVITDGRANFRKSELSDMSQDLRDTVDGNIFCIGLTSEIEEAELLTVCGGDDDRVMVLNDFDELRAQLSKLLADMVSGFGPDPTSTPCVPQEEQCFCCCTPEQYFGGGLKGYYGH